MKLRLGLVLLLACSACALAGEPEKEGGNKERKPSPEQRRQRLEQARQAMLDRIRELNEREAARRKSPNEKNHPAIRRAFRPVVQQANRSTVTVLCDKQPAALGTVVAADGLILTKASELRGTVACKLPGEKKPREVDVLGISDPHDLALLKVQAEGLQPVRWAEATPPVGSLVATPDGRPEPAAIGVISVAPRELKDPGFLGISFQGTGTAPRIGEVIPKTAAAIVGLKPGDLILKIDAKEVKTRQAVADAIRDYDPGDTVELRFRRGDKEQTVKARLGSRRLSPRRQSRLDLMNRYGTPLSERRSDFESAIQHDTVLLPSQCGGPLVDLDGKAVGVNVARAGRVESYAIPAADVLPLLAELKSGRLAPGPDFARSLKLKAIARRIARHERDLRKAQRDKADAERRMRQAKSAIEKAMGEKAQLEAERPGPPEPQEQDKGDEAAPQPDEGAKAKE